MPLYDFICPKGHYEEALLRDTAKTRNKTRVHCSICGRVMRRVDFSVPAVAQFKGAGFHAVDYGAPTKSTPKVKE